MDPTKHVVVAFRTDWCEHCKEIDKCFEDIKKELKKDIHDIIFAKVNYDENDFDFEIKSFPTVYIYKKDLKEKPIHYEGMRDYEVLLNFLEDQLGDKRSLYEKKMPEELSKQYNKQQEMMKEKGYTTVPPEDLEKMKNDEEIKIEEL